MTILGPRDVVGVGVDVFGLRYGVMVGVSLVVDVDGGVDDFLSLVGAAGLVGAVGLVGVVRLVDAADVHVAVPAVHVVVAALADVYDAVLQKGATERSGYSYVRDHRYSQWSDVPLSSDVAVDVDGAGGVH